MSRRRLGFGHNQKLNDAKIIFGKLPLQRQVEVGRGPQIGARQESRGLLLGRTRGQAGPTVIASQSELHWSDATLPGSGPQIGACQEPRGLLRGRMQGRAGPTTIMNQSEPYWRDATLPCPPLRNDGETPFGNSIGHAHSLDALS